jgi:protein associated with RNAse G/E
VEKSRDNLGFYEIEDVDLEITSLIAEEVLEDPTLNLIEWYRNELDEGDLYNNAYTKSTLQNMEQCDSPTTSDSEISEFPDAESVLSVLLDMFDEDQDSDFDSLPDLQPVSDTDSDCESQTVPEGGSYFNSEPSIADLELNSVEIKSDSLESSVISDMGAGSDSDSSLGDLTGYELGKVGDILAWKVREVLTHCQPFPDDEIEALPSEFFNEKPRFEVTRGEEFPNDDMYTISDHFHGIIASIHIARLRHDTFSIGKWYAEICAKGTDHRSSVVREWMRLREYHETTMGAVREQHAAHILEMACPFAFEDDDVDRMNKRFDVQIDCHDITHLVIYDNFRQVVSQLPHELIEDPKFDLVNWYEFRLAQFELEQFDFTEEKVREVATDELAWPRIWKIIQETWYSPINDVESGNLEINGVQVAQDKYPAVQRNAASVKDKTRVLPKPVTLTVKIDGHPARALIDSGSLGDFMSTNLADQLKVKREELDAPLGLQLAVQGSRSKINF